MKQRTERLSAEIQAIVSELLVRGELKDPRVRNAGIITITRVRVTGDLREAHVAFMVYGADDAALERVRQGLESGRGFVQRAVGRQLHTRATPSVHFEVDRALEGAFRVREILTGIASESPTAAGDAGGDGDAPGLPAAAADGDDDDDDDR